MKEKIERQMKQDWQAEKAKYERELQATHEGHKAILGQIDESKKAVARLESKIKEIER